MPMPRMVAMEPATSWINAQTSRHSRSTSSSAAPGASDSTTVGRDTPASSHPSGEKSLTRVREVPTSIVRRASLTPLTDLARLSRYEGNGADRRAGALIDLERQRHEEAQYR